MENILDVDMRSQKPAYNNVSRLEFCRKIYALLIEVEYNDITFSQFTVRFGELVFVGMAFLPGEKRRFEKLFHRVKALQEMQESDVGKYTEVYFLIRDALLRAIFQT